MTKSYSQQRRLILSDFAKGFIKETFPIAVWKDDKVLEIRQADKSDIPDLVKLDDECFDTYYYRQTKYSESDFIKYFRRSKSILLIAIRDSCLVGYVAGTIRILRFGSIAHLDSIAVSPAARNEGIGGNLLDLFIQGAKRQGSRIVLLEVAKANKDGLDFFSRRGFQKTGDLAGYYGRGLDGVLMQLNT